MSAGKIIFYVGFIALIGGGIVFARNRYYLGKTKDKQKGKQAKTKGSSINVRSKPEVSSTTLLGKVSGTFGKIVSNSKGKDGFTWHKVKLNSPLKGSTFGWAREDVINIV